jgi:hypothetical protein
MLSRLQLEQNHAGAGAAAFCMAIAPLRGGTASLDNLQRLDMGDNFIEDAAMCDLIRGLTTAGAKEDDESEYDDDAEDPDATQRLGLAILDLRNNHFGSAACHQLKIVLAASDNDEQTSVAGDAVPAVAMRMPLTELNLNGCSVGAAGAAVIGEMLRSNSTLRILGLAGRRPNGRRALMSDDRLGAEGLRVSAVSLLVCTASRSIK